jgi:predicted glycosyltransferase
MAAADVVLAMGGYNTVCELLTLRKRALIVPRVKPGVEQLLRAERMAARGYLRMVHPDALTPATLAVALQAELADWRSQRSAPPLRHLDGLAGVTAALFDAIGHRSALQRAVAQRAASAPHRHASTAAEGAAA